MIGLRDKPWRRFGASLGGLALVLQLMLSSVGLTLAITAADLLGSHALCLGGGGPPSPIPSAPVHNHDAFCCLWHQIAGVEPVAVSTPVPAAFAYVAAIEPGIAAFTPGPRYRPANARAPPRLI